MDGAGNLYGTALFGGDDGVGTVFELVPNALRTKWKFKRLYSFCAQSNCVDGSDPEAALIIDNTGSLYGVTMAGGLSDGGVAYKLTPNARHTKWAFSILYSFCALGDCVDGREPQANLSYAGKESGAPYDGASPLFGTASQAGTHKQGVVFMLTPGTPSWNEQVLYDFCASANCADGADPVAAVTVSAAGNIFGTTYTGGASNNGTVFELTAAGGQFSRATTTETVLHSFCSSANCTDGAFPAAAVHIDAEGNLLGTTFGGGHKGKSCTDIGVSGCGTAFKLVPNGAASQETVLYDFCGRKNCSDGGYPLAGLLIDPSGKIHGATLYGGVTDPAPGAGTLFDLNATETALHRFCARANCTDGIAPEGDLLMDGSGNLFGTNLFFGANGDGGTVFELTP
jgi:uncharacterized repeat protein (TIGR03803 family)